VQQSTDWLDTARVFAGIAVVTLHVASAVVIHQPISSVEWWIGNFVDSSVRWCVPFFVMISGALLLDNRKQYASFICFYKQRIKRIALPLFCWSLFFSCWAGAKEYMKQGDINFVLIFTNLIRGQPNSHLWYLFMLIGLYAFIPWLKILVSGLTRQRLLGLLILLFTLAIIDDAQAYADELGSVTNRLFFGLWFVWFLGYFFLGHYINTFMPKTVSKRLLASIFFAALLLTAVGNYYAQVGILPVGVYFYDYLSVNVVAMSITLMLLVKQMPTISWAKKYSAFVFGVYLIHPIFIDLFRLTGLTVERFNPTWSIPICVLLVLMCSIVTLKGLLKTPYARHLIK
jgi:surface polysaccharide O-acyltransferase-like enzyme